MPGDYSRNTFKRENHYSGVLKQQGRVELDADDNEQLAIQHYRDETEAIDVIGQSGVPKKNDGFKIGVAAGGKDLTISAGRYYVEGLLCELDKASTYTSQPYLPNPEPTGPSNPATSPPSRQINLPSDGRYLVFLDAWKQEITALDNEAIREVALGGPDTATRLQNVWQVGLLKVGHTSPPTSPPTAISCKSPLPEFDQLRLPASGKLRARTQPPQPEASACLLPPETGYNRLENQLYRVEVHTGSLNQATFKWSRDNASVETTIKNIAGPVLTVADLGKDAILNFAPGQWVEIVDVESTLKAAPHALAEILQIGPGPNEITLKTSAVALAGLPGLKLRRWDQTVNATSSGVSAALSNWIDLEGGIQVSFEAGDYRPGDYWLIPARTATGEIEWPRDESPSREPISQSPQGIQHHYSRLALIESTGGTLNFVADCRKHFPSLTEICAEDVCFNNNTCNFAGAETVQDALDMLCAANDLRFHNKHLHGWGIVCGLQVECCTDEHGPCLDPAGKPGRYVTVRHGYAIDCEGNDINLKEDQKVDLLGLMKGPQTLSPPALQDGDVSLILDPRANSQSPFRVEPYKQPSSKWQSLLAGTLLADVLQDCIKGLIDFVKAEFTTPPGEEKALVGPTQKRITTFSNLLIQLVNKQNGSFVFLSGEKGKSGANLEDSILRDFYHKLREKLQSHTFCAMFDGARPFPDYPAEYSDRTLTTIFGKGFQKRFRVAPNSKVGYSVGASNKINVYDLEKGEMVAELEFPGGTSAIVQDVAFSKDGKQLYAVATLQDKDSMFALATVSGDKYTWGKPSMICDVLLLTLGTSSASEKVFAVGRSKGLYEIDPLNVVKMPAPIYPFNAAGHLVMGSTQAFSYATANDTPSESAKGIYDRVFRLKITVHEDNPTFFSLPGAAGLRQVGQDDIALDDVDQGKLYVVMNPPPGSSTKQMAVFSLDKPPAPISVTDLKEDTNIRVAYNPVTKQTMLTYEDSYRIGLLAPNNQLHLGFRHPVQISPLSIALSPDRERVYVLNYVSNTISSIPAGLLSPVEGIPLKPLVEYRAGVLNAFADLLGGLIQYLKDCFCDHFLINCPTCDDDDKLYLARITIKNGQVFKICNFSLRKYVHSFPTVEYWLSVIPIIPLITKAVEGFCCAALPGLFSKFKASSPDVTEGPVPVANNTVKSERLREGITFGQQTDFRGALKRVMSTSAPGRALFTDFVTHQANRTLVAPPPAAVQQSEVVAKPADEARKKLEDAKIVVEKVEPYDPKKAGRHLLRFSQAPPHLEEGMRVNLITKDGKVLFYTLAEQSSPQLQDLRSEVEAARKAVDQVSPQITDLRMQVEGTKSVVDRALPEIENLRADVAITRKVVDESKTAVAGLTPQLQELSEKVERARSAAEQTSPQIQDLRQKIQATDSQLATNKASIEDALRVRDELNNLRKELLLVRQTHQQELADRDKVIIELQGSARAFQATVKTVSDLQIQVDKLTRPPK